MYIIINNDLGMTKGKTCAQVGHVVRRVTSALHNANNSDYKNWLRTGEAKIVLKSTESNMLRLIEKYKMNGNTFWCMDVRDAGLTQIAPNSLTAIAFCPVLKKLAPNDLTELKLL